MSLHGGQMPRSDGHGRVDGGASGEAEEGDAGNSGGDSADDPAVHGGGLSHELVGDSASAGPLDEEGVAAGGGGVALAAKALALGATLVDKMPLEVKADDRGEGILDDHGAALGLALLVASLVGDVELNDVLAGLGAHDLLVVGVAGHGSVLGALEGVVVDVLVVGGAEVVVVGGLLVVVEVVDELAAVGGVLATGSLEDLLGELAVRALELGELEAHLLAGVALVGLGAGAVVGEVDARAVLAGVVGDAGVHVAPDEHAVELLLLGVVGGDVVLAGLGLLEVRLDLLAGAAGVEG